MIKQYIFIDESVDPGFKTLKGSSKFFVLVGVVVKNIQDLDSLTQNIKELRTALLLPINYEFKFSKSNTKVRQAFLDHILKLNGYELIVCVVHKESRTTNIDYGEAVYKMLEMLAPCQIKLIIDGKFPKTEKTRIKSLLRKKLKGKTYILDTLSFRGSKADELIQFADIIAGAYNRILQGDKDFASFSTKLKKKIYANPTL